MLDTSAQLQTFKSMLHILDSGELDKRSPVFKHALDWLRTFPGELGSVDRAELQAAICTTFKLTQNELQIELVGGVNGNGTGHGERTAREIEDSLWKLIPPGGFFHRYCDYTSHSEAPLAYHLFSALVGIGATVNRRVWFNMGYYRVFPNMGIIILGPSGIKKTSAANIMVGMLTELELTKIYSEKLTPEQLVEAMKDSAQGLIYAPEMAVFLGRQRYMEGIVPLITRFMDCPDVWASETVMRGKKVLRDVAISSLMCSTLDWFISNTSEDVVSGGFIARNIIVAQDSSPRLEPIPKPGDGRLRQALVNDLARIHSMEGELTLTSECAARYDSWYRTQKLEAESAEHELLVTYYQRKPDHVKRVAMCLHLADCDNLVLDRECFDRAILIMDWVEQFIPPMLKRMFKTAVGHEQDAVLGSIKSAGGVVTHSELVRRMQYRMNAKQMREIINSLKEADMVEEIVDKLMHVYKVKEV